MENSLTVPPKVKQICHMTQQFYLWVYYQKNWKHILYINVITALFKDPKGRNNSNMRKKINEKASMAFTYRDIILP